MGGMGGMGGFETIFEDLFGFQGAHGQKRQNAPDKIVTRVDL